MAGKRKTSVSSPSSKRPRYSSEDDEDDESAVHLGEQPRNHPIFGQKNAFPGLDEGGDGLPYGPPSDGIEYLRSVR